jgi:hypothetical protein
MITKGDVVRPTWWEAAVTMALLDQLLADFEPVDEEDREHARIASRVVARWFRAQHAEAQAQAGEVPDGVTAALRRLAHAWQAVKAIDWTQADLTARMNAAGLGSLILKRIENPDVAR